jgi:hypothetical protein
MVLLVLPPPGMVRRFAQRVTMHDIEVARTPSMVARVARLHLPSGALDEALDAPPRHPAGPGAETCRDIGHPRKEQQFITMRPAMCC